MAGNAFLISSVKGEETLGHECAILSMQNVWQQVSQLLFRAQASKNVPCG